MSEPENRRPGRPKNVEGPSFPRLEVDKLLVHGEAVLNAKSKVGDVYYPSHKELAVRFGVSRSTISNYSKQHNCGRRRKIAEERLKSTVDKRVLKTRVEAMALRKEDELRIIDAYLRGFETAVEEGRVRFDSPSDFNSMLRLKQFINGGADSRQEVHATVSLADIQSRHKEVLKARHAGQSVTGEVGGSTTGVIESDENQTNIDIEKFGSSQNGGSGPSPSISRTGLVNSPLIAETPGSAPSEPPPNGH